MFEKETAELSLKKSSTLEDGPKTHKVNVLGRTYYIKSNDDEAFVKQVIDYFQSKVDEISNQSNLDSNAILLTALNISGEFIKLRDRQSATRNALGNRIQSVMSQIDDQLDKMNGHA